MKAVRFIAISGFLAVFGFCGLLTAEAQETKENKDSKPSTDAAIEVKPVEPAKIAPTLGTRQRERYRIGMFDVLEITVAKHAELSQGSIKLDNTGRIRMARIEKPILALCKTENELAEEIRKIYAETYLRDPFVSVVVREQNSQPYSVIGAVKKPGSFFTNRDMTLLEILSYAGGPDVEFAGNKVQVARVGNISGCADLDESRTDDDEIFFTYILSDVLKNKTNPQLRPGDIVSVLDADIIYVFGNVIKQGKIMVKEPITLMQAIASAEGLKPSSKNKIRVLRQKEGSLERVEMIYDLKEISQSKIDDPYLQPNDIVAVSEDPTKSVLRKLGNAFTNGLPTLLLRGTP